MKRQIMGGCLGIIVLVGCNGKLQVDSDTPLNTGDFVGGAFGVDPPDGAGGKGVITPFPDPNVAGAAPVGGGGSLGAEGDPCISGGVWKEGEGTPAVAEIRALDRCNEGLTCNSDGRCVAVPDCGETVSGECVVYRAQGSGGTGGMGGPGTAGAPAMGTAGRAPGEIHERPRVRALTADADHVYWIDYGTRDALGNHRGDGAVVALSLADGVVTTLSDELPGPTAFGVTETHVYVSADGGGLVGTIARPRLLRVAFAGGSPEVIQSDAGWGLDGACTDCFASLEDRAFWTTDEAVYSMGTNDDSGSVFLDGFAARLIADETHLYYSTCCVDEQPSILRVPLEGGAPETVAEPSKIFSLHGDFVYGLEPISNDRALILNRVEKSGGAWRRVRGLGRGHYPNQLQFVGDRYFLDAGGNSSGDTGHAVVTAVLGSDEPVLRLLEREADVWSARGQWVGTAQSLFWTDGERVYSRPIPTDE